MPTYEYACGSCGHEMETFQSIRDERLVKCPECSEDSLRRLIGRGAGIIFKGTGFYQTDYKKTAAPKGETSGSDGDKKPAATGAGDSTSSKPATDKPAANTSTNS